jgi:hypothetical protein
MPQVADTIRTGGLTPHKIRAYGNIVYQVAALLWHHDDTFGP